MDDSQDVANSFCVLLEAAIMTHAWFASSGRETQKVTYFVIYSRAMPIAKRVVRVVVGLGKVSGRGFSSFCSLHLSDEAADAYAGAVAQLAEIVAGTFDFLQDVSSISYSLYDGHH